MIGELLAYGPTYIVIFGVSLLGAAGLACIVLIGLRTGRFGPWRFVLRDRYPTAFRLEVVYLVVAVVVLLATPFYIICRHHTGH